MENFCKLKVIYQFIQDIEAEIQLKHELSVNECMTMCAINRGVVSAGNLAIQVGLSKSRLSKILAGLEKKEMIKRTFAKDDKRKTDFKLTKKGEVKAREVEESDVSIPDFHIGYAENNS